MASPAEQLLPERRSIEERAERVLEQARELAARGRSWVDFSHALFDPAEGIVARAFPTLRQRREFTLTPHYADIYDLLFALKAKGDSAPPPAAAPAQSRPGHGWRNSEALRAIQPRGPDEPQR